MSIGIVAPKIGKKRRTYLETPPLNSITKNATTKKQFRRNIYSHKSRAIHSLSSHFLLYSGEVLLITSKRNMAAAGGGAVKDVKSKAELDNIVAVGEPVVLHFWASWCEASKHMDQVFSHLSTDFPLAHFLRVWVSSTFLCIVRIILWSSVIFVLFTILE